MKWLLLKYEQSTLGFIPPVPGKSRKRAGVTEITEGGHDAVVPVYHHEFADRGISHDFAERARHLYLEKGDDYTEYPILGRQDRVMGYRNIPVASEKV